MKEFKKGDLVRMITIHERHIIPNRMGVVLGRCPQPHLHDYGYYRVMWFHKGVESTSMWFMMEKIDEGR